jgi:septal ring factor EnvC (AmiA/AmiB activator)
LSQNLRDAEKKLDELNAEVRRLHEMLNVVTIERDQHLHANTVRLENANKLQNMSACKQAELQKKLDESDAEVRRMREMLTLRTDEKAKLQKQLDDLQPILSALSKHWGGD